MSARATAIVVCAAVALTFGAQAEWRDYKAEVTADWETYVEETRRYWQIVLGRALVEVDYLGGVIHVGADAFTPDDARTEVVHAARAIVGGTDLWKDLERLPADPHQAITQVSRKEPEVFPTKEGYRAETMIYLARDHMRRRAARYVDTITRECEPRGLPINLVLAQIEAESMFNPLAFSSAGAIGLMQLVPESGGRHAMRLVGLEDRPPSREELEDPHFNIKLGCAYLAYLVGEEFDFIDHIETRRAVALAAYNWGATNVHRRLGPTRELSPSKFDYRLASAPPETRTYVRRILKRREFYQVL